MISTLPLALAQGLGTPPVLRGTITDPSEGIVEGAAIGLDNERRGIHRATHSDSNGSFQFSGVPSGTYVLTATAPGFHRAEQTVAIGARMPEEVTLRLAVAGTASSMTVRGGASGETELASFAHENADKELLDQVPVQNQATGFSDLVTRTTPGVAADGNGFAHPLGEHADTSVAIDNQPITDQQAKIFSNQLSTSIIQTMEVITGAPPAEYGDKTSLIINVTTLSGLGRTRPSGSVSTQFGSFGSVSQGVTYGAGNNQWGSFSAVNASLSGRFLDTPEFRPIHSRGNAESIFERLDWQLGNVDTMQLNLTASRSWFQTPNTYDADAAGQDQRSQIRSFNIAPGWTHVLSPGALLTLKPFFRFDRSEYFPSANPLRDRPATLAQSRYLTNTGFRTDLAWFGRVLSGKTGVSYWRTLLRENFSVALTDPAYNAACLDSVGDPVSDSSGLAASSCTSAGLKENPEFVPGLAPFDLSRGGKPYSFHGNAEVKELAVYVQSSVRPGRFSMNPGIRYDRYNGLSSGHQLQPRLGLTYRLPMTNTVLRLSYARLFETPYNENLIISSQATASTAGANPFGTFRSSPPQPGRRNQFNAGAAQTVGKHLTLDADYFWKFTKNAFDFDSLFLTPITFPIGWKKSKIDGLAARVTLTNLGGFSAHMVMGHTRSRFFGPETGGLVFNNNPSGEVFRIDHSEEFGQTTFLRYQHGKGGVWGSLTWRFNSGLALPGVLSDYREAFRLTGDEQAQMGLYCGPRYATRSTPLRTCESGMLGATRVLVPPSGTQNDDLNPTRVSPRNVIDFGFGTDDLLHTERRKVHASITIFNAANRTALYNFLSTFSGTHFVTPRALQGELKYTF